LVFGLRCYQLPSLGVKNQVFCGGVFSAVGKNIFCLYKA